MFSPLLLTRVPLSGTNPTTLYDNKAYSVVPTSRSVHYVASMIEGYYDCISLEERTLNQCIARRYLAHSILVYYSDV